MKEMPLLGPLNQALDFLVSEPIQKEDDIQSPSVFLMSPKNTLSQRANILATSFQKLESSTFKTHVFYSGPPSAAETNSNLSQSLLQFRESSAEPFQSLSLEGRVSQSATADAAHQQSSSKADANHKNEKNLFNHSPFENSLTRLPFNLNATEEKTLKANQQAVIQKCCEMISALSIDSGSFQQLGQILRMLQEGLGVNIMLELDNKTHREIYESISNLNQSVSSIQGMGKTAILINNLSKKLTDLQNFYKNLAENEPAFPNLSSDQKSLFKNNGVV